MSNENPTINITSAGFELADRLLHLDTLAHCYDIRERTTLNKTDNLNTIFWEHKGSYATDSSLECLLRSFGNHHCYQSHMSWHEHHPGASNKMVDDSSRLFNLSENYFFLNLTIIIPRKIMPDCVDATRASFSGDLALYRKKYNVESLLIDLP